MPHTGIKQGLINLGDMVSRIDDILEPVEQIARGGKPDKYPRALYDQMKRMWDGGFLIESVASYVIRPDEIGKTARLHDGTEVSMETIKGVTSVHPISAELMARKENIDNAAGPAGVRNYKVLGLDPFFRRLSSQEGVFDSHDPLDVCDDAAALILTRSDIHGLRQALHILKGKAQGDSRALRTKLIIQNTHNEFWNPVMTYLGLNKTDPKTLASLNIAVTYFPGGINRNREEDSTLHALIDMGEIATIDAAPNRFQAPIQQGDRIYVCSGSSHKSVEVGQILDAMHAQVDVMPLNAAIDIKPREADEESRSFEGNNLEKMRATQSRILGDVGYDNAVKSLCGSKLKPENVWLLVDDRGFGFKDQRIIKTTAFDPVRPLLNPYERKPAPGAELAPVFKVTSREGLFSGMLGQANNEIMAETGQMPDNTIEDTACYVLVRLDWLQDPANDLRYLATFGRTRSIALTEPRPAGMTTQSDYFEAPTVYNPVDTPFDNLRTKAQIPHYTATSSEMALALRAMGQLTDIPEHAKKPQRLSRKFGEEARDEPPFKLADFYTLFPNLMGHGISHLPRRVSNALNGSFRILTGSNGTYDVGRHAKPRNIIAPFARCDDSNRQAVDSALEKMRTLYKDADGFLLTPDNPQMQYMPGVKWLKTLFYFSLVVGKQVHDKAIATKFFGIADWASQKSWKDQSDIFSHLNKTALLGDRFELMATTIRAPRENVIDDNGTIVSLKRALKSHRARYIRPTITEKPVLEKEGAVKVPDDLFRVTIYCSASLGDETAASKEALRFTTKMAGEGFALINGGGSREGVMRQTSEGVHNFRRHWKKTRPGQAMPRNHVSSFQCHDTFEREGGWHPDNEYALILETIEQRMAHLQNTDGEILLAGGAGSIQEIAASLLMREWGLTPTIHRPIIIVNQVVDGLRAFDPLVAMMCDSEKKRLNVHVVDTTDEALEILKASRLAMANEPGMQIYIPQGGLHPAPVRKPAIRVA